MAEMSSQNSARRSEKESGQACYRLRQKALSGCRPKTERIGFKKHPTGCVRCGKRNAISDRRRVKPLRVQATRAEIILVPRLLANLRPNPTNSLN
jgi:hypothetical protein